MNANHEICSTEYGLTLAGVDTIESADQATKVIRESANTISLTIASMLDFLDEPLKGQFTKVKGQIDTMLAGMAPSDQAPAALGANRVLNDLLSVLGMAQSMMTQLSEVAKGARTDVANLRASMTGEIENAIKTKVEAGELTTKEALQGKIDAAVTEAKNVIAAEQTLISTRRTALNSASLPVPADDVLKTDEKGFTAKQETAKARLEALKPYKVAPEKLTQLCWNTDQAAFDMALELLKENTPAGKPNGFIGQNQPSTPASASRLFNTCC